MIWVRGGEPWARVEEAASGWWSQEVKTKGLAGGWMYMQADPGFLEKRCQFLSWGNWWVQQVGGVLELAAFAPRCPLISRWEADGVLLLSLLLRPRLEQFPLFYHRTFALVVPLPGILFLCVPAPKSHL